MLQGDQVGNWRHPMQQLSYLGMCLVGLRRRMSYLSQGVSTLLIALICVALITYTLFLKATNHLSRQNQLKGLQTQRIGDNVHKYLTPGNHSWTSSLPNLASFTQWGGDGYNFSLRLSPINSVGEFKTPLSCQINKKLTLSYPRTLPPSIVPASEKPLGIALTYILYWCAYHEIISSVYCKLLSLI